MLCRIIEVNRFLRLCLGLSGMLIAVLPAPAISAASPTLERLLEIEAEMRSNPAKASAPGTVRHLERLTRSRHIEENETALAAALLAEHYLRRSRPDPALKAVADYAEYSPVNLVNYRAACFLVYARARGAQGFMREAVQRIEYARDNAEGEPRGRAVAALGELAMDTGNFAEAVKRYREALNYGDRFFRPKRISETEKAVPVPGADGWHRLRPHLENRRREAERRRDIELYGEGFYHWREARRLHLAGRREKASRAYSTLIRRFPDTVYAEGARFHTAQCLLALGRVDQAVRALEEFVRADRHGLWRGEALYTLGEIHLRRRRDPRAANRFFERALEWVSTVRRRDREIRLHMVPEKARAITRPATTPLKIVDFELYPSDVTPDMVVNRRTTDWYLDRLAWDSLYMLGFLAALEDDWDQAKEHWTRAFNLNEQLQRQYASQLGSLHLRLMNAVRGKCFLARHYELKAFRGHQNRERRLILMLADFDALRLKWDSAEKLYNELLDNRSISNAQRAAVMQALGTALNYSGRRQEAVKIFEELTTRYAELPSSYEALLQLAHHHQHDLEKCMKILRHAERVGPTPEYKGGAVFRKGLILMGSHGKFEEAREVWRGMIKDYSNTKFGEYGKKMIEISYSQEAKRKQ